MSWTKSEKLNEWILRAYENGKREEQERIIGVIESIMNQHQVASEEFDVLNDLIECIKNSILPCAWCGLKEMDVYASANGKDICVNCEDKSLEDTTKGETNA